ncbi:hypothetical protein B0T14DRAFT_41253 [Immersiella caudata]|uniref:Uncharacterized protein n=1 Tax=Immersiella caudata TaxID=314043 RepID=A0AA40CCT5_9PEZI|nr:hypothetical protein B0T14DRAFT_41253 [Immersiella caudata]
MRAIPSRDTSYSRFRSGVIGDAGRGCGHQTLSPIAPSTDKPQCGCSPTPAASAVRKMRRTSKMAGRCDVGEFGPLEVVVVASNAETRSPFQMQGTPCLPHAQRADAENAHRYFLSVAQIMSSACPVSPHRASPHGADQRPQDISPKLRPHGKPQFRTDEAMSAARTLRLTSEVAPGSLPAPKDLSLPSANGFSAQFPLSSSEASPVEAPAPLVVPHRPPPFRCFVCAPPRPSGLGSP